MTDFEQKLWEAPPCLPMRTASDGLDVVFG